LSFDPKQHHRRSIRLPGYDYTQPGAYFVTICAHKQKSIFRLVVDGKILLNTQGQVVVETWASLSTHHPYLDLDAFVIMPNHVHGVLVLRDETVPDNDAEARTQLPEIVRAFKSFSSRRINMVRRTQGKPVWQRGYYEHVIRDEPELDAVRRYIEVNPAKWTDDIDNPANISTAARGYT
jgi:putative transposase